MPSGRWSQGSGFPLKVWPGVERQQIYGIIYYSKTSVLGNGFYWSHPPTQGPDCPNFVIVSNKQCSCSHNVFVCTAMSLRNASHMHLAQNVLCSLKKCVMIAAGKLLMCQFQTCFGWLYNVYSYTKNIREEVWPFRLTCCGFLMAV